MCECMLMVEAKKCGMLSFSEPYFRTAGRALPVWTRPRKQSAMSVKGGAHAMKTGDEEEDELLLLLSVFPRPLLFHIQSISINL